MCAKLLLSVKHGLARLDNVWDVGGGQRPVLYLTNKVVTILCFVVCYLQIIVLMKLLLREYP